MIYNLYEEAVELLKANNLSFEDVLWIGGDDFQIPIDKFVELSVNHKYIKNDFCSTLTCGDLVIVGNDWWLSRATCDGYWEYWIFNRKPEKPSNIFLVKTLDYAGYPNTLKKSNNIEIESTNKKVLTVG